VSTAKAVSGWLLQPRRHRKFKNRPRGDSASHQAPTEAGTPEKGSRCRKLVRFRTDNQVGSQHRGYRAGGGAAPHSTCRAHARTLPARSRARNSTPVRAETQLAIEPLCEGLRCW